MAESGVPSFVFRTKPGEEFALVESWINTPALRDLVEAEGGQWPEGELREVVAGLERFSAVWDRRNGASRLIFKEGDESRTDERACRVYAAARELGLLDPPPPTLTTPDYLLILGGLATGVEPRVRYAAELLEKGLVSTNWIVALGSFRPLQERERPVAATYAPGALYEIDLLTAMMSQAFESEWIETSDGNPAVDPAHAEQRRKRHWQPNLATYAARSSDPENRPANTADTYKQFADDVDLQSGQTLLIVTSSIYLPFQHMDAVCTLVSGHGVSVESLGVPSSSASPAHPPSGYLQEIRSAIRSAHSLLPGHSYPPEPTHRPSCEPA